MQVDKPRQPREADDQYGLPKKAAQIVRTQLYEPDRNSNCNRKPSPDPDPDPAPNLRYSRSMGVLLGRTQVRIDTQKHATKKEKGFSDISTCVKDHLNKALERGWDLIPAVVGGSTYNPPPPIIRLRASCPIFDPSPWHTRMLQRYSPTSMFAGDWDKGVSLSNLGRCTFPEANNYIEVNRSFLAGGIFPYGFIQLQVSTTKVRTKSVT
mmetsp:Transcript_75692/g.215476  ORF Transcript_75692/g.215476 Transcript_75692/m.215476 type:complete len:209 (+) Transcript_75692:1286-1912(+)